MRKGLKIDLAAKPVASPEDQIVYESMFNDSEHINEINTSVYGVMIKNYLLDMLSGDPVQATKQYTIPESPSRRTGGTSKNFESVNLISPRTILSPKFGEENEFPEAVYTDVEAKEQEEQATKQEARQPGTRTEIVIPKRGEDQDELDIINAIIQKYPEGITIHTTGKHPAYEKSTSLAKKGRQQFEQDEEIRIINDVYFEGVLGLPGFLAWNALPLALAHYGGEFSVDHMAEELLIYGDTVTEMFSQNTNEKYVLKADAILKWYEEEFEGRYTHERLFNALKLPASSKVTIRDLERISQILLKLHPGLSFLNDTPEFETLYAQTVALRILFENDSNFKGYLSVHDLKKVQTSGGTEFVTDQGQKQGGLLESLWESQYESDINKNLKCFSYEHFYVFYVTFWELDQDHDKLITEFDLERYASGSVSKLAIKRAFDLLIEIRVKNLDLYESSYFEKYNKKPANDQEMMKFLNEHKEYLFYTDFVRFLIYLENPDLDVAADFWFEVVDVDGDGAINYSDFKLFYTEMRDKMEENGTDIVESEDVFCEIVDFYKSKARGQLGAITLSDLRGSEARGNIFSVMLHFERFEFFDQKDPYTIRNFTMLEKTMWERYCRREYDIEVQGVSGDGY